MSPEPGLALERALSLAFNHLNRRDRTVAEMRAHLLRRDVTEEVVELAIQELTEQGYLDDARFSRLFAADKRDLSHWGSGRIRRALLERGIEAETAEAALAEDGGPQVEDSAPHAEASASQAEASHSAELGRALVLLRRRFPGGTETPRERERALGVLLRRGYDYELAADALAEYRREPNPALGQAG